MKGLQPGGCSSSGDPEKWQAEGWSLGFRFAWTSRACRVKVHPRSPFWGGTLPAFRSEIDTADQFVDMASQTTSRRLFALEAK
jgi:hypothetical protein